MATARPASPFPISTSLFFTCLHLSVRNSVTKIIKSNFTNHGTALRTNNNLIESRKFRLTVSGRRLHLSNCTLSFPSFQSIRLFHNRFVRILQYSSKSLITIFHISRSPHPEDLASAARKKSRLIQIFRFAPSSSTDTYPPISSPIQHFTIFFLL